VFDEDVAQIENPWLVAAAGLLEPILGPVFGRDSLFELRSFRCRPLKPEVKVLVAVAKQSLKSDF
jgi:hypothetical protein